MYNNKFDSLDEQKNFKAIFEYAPVGMIIMCDSNSITQINLAASRVFHKDRSEVIGTRIGDALNCINSFKGKCGCGSSEDCSKCQLRNMLIRVSGTRIAYHGLEIEHIILEDGLEKKKWYRINADPVTIDEKKRLVITLDDITEKKLLEQRIAKSRDFYLTLFENFPMLIWRADFIGKRNYFNKTWLSFRGRPSHHEIGYGWMDGIHPDDKDLYVQTYMDSINNRQSINLHYRLKNSEGIYRWVHEIGRPYNDIDGIYAGYIGVVIDVTEQRIAEEGMKRYQLLSEKANDAILFINTDGRIIEANRSALRMYGFTMEEILAKTIYDIRGANEKEGRDFVIKQLEMAEVDGVVFETLHHKKDNTCFPVEVSSQGAVIGDNKVYLSIIRDISDRKMQEKALQESEEKFRTLFQNGNDSVYVHEIIDKETIITRFIEVNDMASRKLGYTKEELLRMGPWDITAQHSLNLKLEQLKSTMSKKHYTYETVHITKDNAEVPLEASSHYFTMNGKEVILSIARDISERKRTEEDLKRAKEAAEAASRAKSNFLANMSHEIRTPLNGVIGMINMTLMSPLDHEQRENLDIAKASADSLLRVINDILDFSKVEAGKLSLNNVNFSLRDLIEDTIKPHYLRANEKGIELIQKYHGNVPVKLFGDPDRIRQILNNLIGNAVKFTEIGEVTLSVKSRAINSDNIELSFSVTDTGIGIDTNDIDKLFKSFSQVDSSNKRKYGGTGLGLAISKKLVEMMGGQIWVESEKGKGSRFGFSINLKPEKINDKQLHKDSKQTAIDHNIRILLAEDDKINQIFTVRMLEKRGYKVIVVNNGVEVLEKLNESQIDVILMDIQMPEMDGVEATRIIRESEKKVVRHIPIVAITAHAIQGDREKYLSCGMDEYIAKPFQIEELYNVIEKVYKKGFDIEVNNTLKQVATSENLPSSNGIDTKLWDLINRNEKGLLDDYKSLKNIYSRRNSKETLTSNKLAILIHSLKTKFAEEGIVSLKTLAFKIELCIRREDFNEGEKLIIQLINEFENIVNPTEIKTS
jgi:two-component system, sensor histidine kinase